MGFIPTNYSSGVADLGFFTGGTERMRLDSAGKLLVGRTGHSGYGVANFEGGIDVTGGNAYICRDTGNVLIGTTASAPNGAEGIKIVPDYHGTNKSWTAISTAGYQTETTLSIYSTAVTAYRFYVDAAGTISAVNTTISSLSDERVKENIRDLDDGLAKVMQLQS